MTIFSVFSLLVLSIYFLLPAIAIDANDVTSDTDSAIPKMEWRNWQINLEKKIWIQEKIIEELKAKTEDMESKLIPKNSSDEESIV